MAKLSLEKSIERLEEIIPLEGTEVADSWRSLLNMKVNDYCFSDDFNKSLEKEICRQAEDSLSYEIIEEEVKTPAIYRKRRTLRLKNE